MQNRQNALLNWVQQQLNNREATLVPLSSDASFRNYYRCHTKQHSYVVMDAPPDKEPIAPFIQAASLLSKNGVQVPRIYQADREAGFALLEDFGDTLMLRHLSLAHADQLYRSAIDQILLLQKSHPGQTDAIKSFDCTYMLQEMQLMHDWFLTSYLKKNTSAAEKAMLDESFVDIAQKVASQKTVLIHRDFHSRNLMVLNERCPASLGVIDFQDAMIGPYSYDLVSLLKDCYIEWDRQQQLDWLRYYFQNSPVAANDPFSQLVADYDRCGLQRHLKVLGIFSRLHLRDKKNGFVDDIPLTLKYIIHCLAENGWYPELLDFLQGIHLP